MLKKLAYLHVRSTLEDLAGLLAGGCSYNNTNNPKPKPLHKPCLFELYSSTVHSSYLVRTSTSLIDSPCYIQGKGRPGGYLYTY